MAIEVKEKNIKTKDVSFPLMLINGDIDEIYTIIIALCFHDESKDTYSGVVLSGTNPHNAIGENSNRWCRSMFREYKGELTLKNQ